MKTLKRVGFAVVTAFACSFGQVALADEAPVPVAKVDSGLGELPHYSQWQEPWLYSQPAEKIDSGLGEMPNVADIKEVWLYAQPAESIDSGLGEMPNVADIKEVWLYSQPAAKLDSGLGEIVPNPVRRTALNATGG